MRLSPRAACQAKSRAPVSEQGSRDLHGNAEAPILVGGSRASAPPRTRQPGGSGEWCAHWPLTCAQKMNINLFRCFGVDFGTSGLKSPSKHCSCSQGHAGEKKSGGREVNLINHVHLAGRPHAEQPSLSFRHFQSFLNGCVRYAQPTFQMDSVSPQ